MASLQPNDELETPKPVDEQLALTATGYRDVNGREYTQVTASCPCGRGGWIRLDKHPDIQAECNRAVHNFILDMPDGVYNKHGRNLVMIDTAQLTAARIEGIKSILAIGKERSSDDTYPLEAFIEDSEEYLSRVYGATLTNDKIEGGLERQSDGSE